MKLKISFILALGISSLYAQEIADWAGFRQAVATYTFDDNLSNQLTIAVPIFDKYGYKASFYIVNNWGPNYSQYAELVAQGYEVGSHSDSHGSTMADSEISTSKSTIESKIPSQQCNTIAYPNCNEPTESTLKQYYISGRICSGQVDSKTPSNYYRISSIICGTTGINTTDAFVQKMEEAINKNGWVTFLIHEVDDGSGYSPTSSTAIEGSLSWAKENDSKIWVTTFRNATMYAQERDASTVTKISGGSDTETYSITHNLSTTLSNYDYPLSIRVNNSNNWTVVSATQGGSSITASIKDGYIYFDAVPNGGNVVLTSGDTESSSSSSITSSSSFSSSSSSIEAVTTPYNGAISVPGVIEAENYDVNAFSRSSSETGETLYRTDDGGIVSADVGYALGYTTAGDYFEYTIDVSTAGFYKVSVRGATGNSTDGSVTVSVGTNEVNVAVVSQGSWDVYSETEGEEIYLTQGEQTLRLTINNSYLNVDWITLTSNSLGTDGLASKIRLNINSGKVKCQVFDVKGQLLKSTMGTYGTTEELWNNINKNLSPGVYVLRLTSDNFVHSLQVRK